MMLESWNCRMISSDFHSSSSPYQISSSTHSARSWRWWLSRPTQWIRETFNIFIDPFIINLVPLLLFYFSSFFWRFSDVYGCEIEIREFATFTSLFFSFTTFIWFRSISISRSTLTRWHIFTVSQIRSCKEYEKKKTFPSSRDAHTIQMSLFIFKSSRLI